MLNVSTLSSGNARLFHFHTIVPGETTRRRTCAYNDRFRVGTQTNSNRILLYLYTVAYKSIGRKLKTARDIVMLVLYQTVSLLATV